jgi:hypothetical protein
MNSTTARRITVLAFVLAACAPKETATILPVPKDALEVRQVDFLDGHAHQTDFTLKVKFPNAPALEHYSNAIQAPWIRCDWDPEWQSFLDSTVTPVQTVHRQLHMWVNPGARRILALATRYYSASDCAPQPQNSEQRVSVVEYMGVDVDDTIAKLKLVCPAKVTVRSSSTPQRDGRQASRCGQTSSATARGRER